MAYSDEPVLVTPARRWSVKTIAVITFVAVIVGGILFVPLYQHNLDEEAHDARRGPHQGALYDISASGTPHTIELGWIAPALSAVITPTPASDATLEVVGDFGTETLSWNTELNGFGPGKLRIDPYAHQKVKLTLRQGDRVLWTDSLWLYGVPAGHEH
ncbi:MAG: hypothetical protein WC205_09450 [Opitutaceae bacterium]|jgi:hypothetical protein